LALDDKFDDIKKLIDTGKEKGYLTYDQVNDLIPHDVHSPEDLDDLLTTIGTQGIDVLEGPKLPSATLDKKFDESEEGEDVELDLTPGALEKTNDPVRMYLREMGTVPLLTREGEVEIAKRIERGGRQFRAFQHVDALRANRSQQVVQILGTVHVLRYEIVYLIVGKVALLFPGIDQLFYIVVLVFKSQEVSSNSSIRSRGACGNVFTGGKLGSCGVVHLAQTYRV